MIRRMSLIAVLGGVACGGGSSSGDVTAIDAAAEAAADSTPPSEDTAIDAATTDVRDDEGASDTAVPDAPLDAAEVATDSGPTACDVVTLGSLRAIFSVSPSVTGATVAYGGCAKTTTAIGGASGSWNLGISKNASWYRVSLAGFRTTLSFEIPDGVSTGKTVGLQLVGTDLGGFDATKAHVLLTIAPVLGGCTKNGNTLSLPDHPEAVVHYINAAGADVGSATNVDGLVWITNIVPGTAPVVAPVVAPAVTGCRLVAGFSVGPSTGRAPLVTGAVAATTLQLSR